jgi:hypothetical protein
LNEDIIPLECTLKQQLSILDFIYVRSTLDKSLCAFRESVTIVHKNKLSKLNIQLPNFDRANNVIFNYSSYVLTKKESFLLSLGLDFGLPCYKPNFVNFFLPFEQLAQALKPLNNHNVFSNFRKQCTALAHNYFSRSQRSSNWYPFFKPCDLNTLKNLGKNESIIITKPDKGKGVVILNKADYIMKIDNILSDSTKFRKVEDGLNNFKLVYKIEDKINRFLLKLKNDNSITADTYSSLHSTGSSFGLLYGSPKVHKGPSVPLRPILAAYNLPNYKLAKYLVPLLSHLTINQHSIKNSFEFSKFICSQNINKTLVSYDVESLFTNIPLKETIDIILNKLFPSQGHIYCNFNRSQFKSLLELAVLDTHFLFNKQLFKQSEGMAMGSPLGPTFANIFMNFLESEFLERAPQNIKPSFYNRYVDDILCGFDKLEHTELFLTYINSVHPNIKFSMETEKDNCMNFLDLSIFRSSTQFETSVYRKQCYTGQGLNYYSFCSELFKINSCKTLINRAYKICSNWHSINNELEFLFRYFKANCYPDYIFHKCVRKYFDKLYRPAISVPTVPKKVMYFRFPYLGLLSKKFQNDLLKLLTKCYPFVDVKFIFYNPRHIGSLFKFKDSLVPLMRSLIVYSFNCPKCVLGTAQYIGCSERMLKVRIDGHRGVSHRTQAPLTVQENSPIREHCKSCKHSISYKDFTILESTKSKFALIISESLLIRSENPSLNRDKSSTPLYIA